MVIWLFFKILHEREIPAPLQSVLLFTLKQIIALRQLQLFLKLYIGVIVMGLKWWSAEPAALVIAE